MGEIHAKIQSENPNGRGDLGLLGVEIRTIVKRIT
jgi:hypothetical protein